MKSKPDAGYSIQTSCNFVHRKLSGRTTSLTDKRLKRIEFYLDRKSVAS